MTNLLIILVALGIWIAVGWIMIIGGYYDLKYSYNEPAYKKWLVAPVILLAWGIIFAIYKSFELLDWIVDIYYRLTSYTKKYMKKRK